MLKQSLQQKISQKLSPQQIKLMKLIQLPTIELEQKVKEELEENPAIEEVIDIEADVEIDLFDSREEQSRDGDDVNIDEYLSDDEIPRYRLAANNVSADQDDNSVPLAMGVSSLDFLEQQLSLLYLDNHKFQIGMFLIGCVNDEGYIRRDVLSIVDDLAFSQGLETNKDEVLEVLKAVQNLDPPGIGARSLQECILLQLERKPLSSSIELAKEVVLNHFNALSKKHFDKLILKLSIEEYSLQRALDEISKLNPKPAAFSSNKIVQHIIPDFKISIIDGQLKLTMNKGMIPELKINRGYSEMLEAYKDSRNKSKSKEQKEAILFVKQKLDSASWFIDAIKQRHNTLMLTMTTIMNFQYNYFLSGDECDLKPMILKDIAEIVEMDISTVSRVANSKYVESPYGTFLIKHFFSEAMKNDQGDDVSSKEIKMILNDVIINESKIKPLTDTKLMKILKLRGYAIARRTVAKYREQLNIPVARLRKKLSLK
jgi:RNA polymerase sigma-54 factor